MDGERRETYSEFIVRHGMNKKEIKVVQCFKKSPQPSGIKLVDEIYGNYENQLKSGDRLFIP